ncbi:MAG TPA: hypothetical protein VGF67_22315 [Ktedonobacteraceae bacterium]|jgi:hypothetical protein
MQQQDQSARTATGADQAGLPTPSPADDANEHAATRTRGKLDWPALVAALAVAAFFALTARFNSLPSPSYLPAAVLSAIGCGLLVTAVHTVRKRAGAGLREAGLAGFGMALLQFALTFTYPGVQSIVATAPQYGHAFLLTWGLVGLFATLFSLAGAALGHLAFAVPHPPPSSGEVDEAEELAEQETVRTDEEEGSKADEQEESSIAAQRSLTGFGITAVLPGLLPMMAGYVFAASYDFVMQALRINQLSPALYPTLSLLSGLLPWRLAAPINLSSANGSFIVFTLLWRIPDSALVNPNLFDVQTLEPCVFHATALALLLIVLHDRLRSALRGILLLLLLETLSGLALVLPANLWMLRGLEGALQFGTTAVRLPTIHLLNPLLFLCNVLTGALSCVLVGLIVRRQYRLWTLPRTVPQAEAAEE